MFITIPNLAPLTYFNSPHPFNKYLLYEEV